DLESLRTGKSGYKRGFPFLRRSVSGYSLDQDDEKSLGDQITQLSKVHAIAVNEMYKHAFLERESDKIPTRDGEGSLAYVDLKIGRGTPPFLSLGVLLQAERCYDNIMSSLKDRHTALVHVVANLGTMETIINRIILWIATTPQAHVQVQAARYSAIHKLKEMKKKTHQQRKEVLGTTHDEEALCIENESKIDDTNSVQEIIRRRKAQSTLWPDQI
ncbi:MAG: hypothetical protein Q9224_006432, partial [Gallowayella concinna]